MFYGDFDRNRGCLIRKLSRSQALGWLRELAKLSAFDERPKLAREYLARHGITLVLEKLFKVAFQDRDARLAGDRPIVADRLCHGRSNYRLLLPLIGKTGRSVSCLCNRSRRATD